MPLMWAPVRSSGFISSIGTDPSASLVLPPTDAGGDWQGWRGPQGLGVASEDGLPLRIDAESPELLWKIQVRGDGISSPIVSGGRVFLTSAYPGIEHSTWQTLKLAGLPLLALFVVGLATLWRPRRVPTPTPRLDPLVIRVDALATKLLTVVFLLAVMLAAFVPDLFPAWKSGVFGWGWFYTGGIGLTGLVASLGWLRPRSLARVVGALLLLGCAYYLFRNIGLNSYGQNFKTRERWIMIAPALVGAAWHSSVFFLARGGEEVDGWPRSTLVSAILTLMALVLFVTVNLLQPRAGLVRAVLAFDLATGAQLWDTPLFIAPEEQKYDINSFATPTPCTDGKVLFAYFGSGWAGLDLEGKVLWQGRDDEYAPHTRYGCGASPVMFEDTFIVLQEREYVRPSYIMALDKAGGAQRWRVNPQYASDSYTTPILVAREGTTQLVTASAERAVAHDPRNGELLWQLPLPIRQMVPSLVCFEDMLLVSGGTHTKTSSSGIRLSGQGKDTHPELVWQTNKSVPTVSSPVLIDGCYFTITDGGIVTCFEPRSGTVHWRERVADGRYWSSLVAGDGKVYACSEDGAVSVVAAKPAFELLGRGELGENCYSSPAIADGCVLVRTSKHLYCFGKPQG